MCNVRLVVVFFMFSHGALLGMGDKERCSLLVYSSDEDTYQDVADREDPFILGFSDESSSCTLGRRSHGIDEQPQSLKEGLELLVSTRQALRSQRDWIAFNGQVLSRQSTSIADLENQIARSHDNTALYKFLGTHAAFSCIVFLLALAALLK